MTAGQARSAEIYTNQDNIDFLNYGIDIKKLEADLASDVFSRIYEEYDVFSAEPILLSPKTSDDIVLSFLAYTIVQMEAIKTACNFRVHDSIEDNELIPFEKTTPTSPRISITITTVEKLEQDKGRFFNYYQTNIFIVSE